MTRKEKRISVGLGVALLVSVGVLVVMVRHRVGHASPPICELLCRAGCERDRSCGGFTGDCTAACRQSCALRRPAPPSDPPKCLEKIDSLTCNQADLVGRGDTSMLGPACAPASPGATPPR